MCDTKWGSTAAKLFTDEETKPKKVDFIVDSVL